MKCGTCGTMVLNSDNSLVWSCYNCPDEKALRKRMKEKEMAKVEVDQEEAMPKGKEYMYEKVDTSKMPFDDLYDLYNAEKLFINKVRTCVLSMTEVSHNRYNLYTRTEKKYRWVLKDYTKNTKEVSANLYTLKEAQEQFGINLLYKCMPIEECE